MAVAVHITAHGMSKDDYARVMGELQATGDGEPDGRIHHTAYGDDEVHMFEVWDSPEQFQAHQDKRFALIQGAGLDAGIVDVHPVHAYPD